MRKTKNIYTWFRLLSAVLAICFLMSNTITAQSDTYQATPTDRVSVQEWSGIQDFIDWWTLMVQQYKTKAIIKDRPVNKYGNQTEPVPKDKSTNSHKRIRGKTGITTTDMSVREPG